MNVALIKLKELYQNIVTWGYKKNLDLTTNTRKPMRCLFY